MTSNQNEKNSSMKRIFFLISTLLLIGSLQAQVNFKTRVSKYKLTTDDKLRVTFEISFDDNKVDKNSFTPPDFAGFQKIMGPSQSQEFRWINGRTSGRVSYSYFIQPLKTGKLNIGKASIIVDGKKYETQPVTVEVVKGNKPPVNPANNPKTNNVTTDQQIKDAVIIADISKKNPYVNEAILLTYKLYIPEGYGVSNYHEVQQPQYNGFWVQTLSKNIEGPFQGTLNNKPYTYYILRKKLLFPQQSGKLTLKPISVDLTLQVPVYRNFFGMRVPDVETKQVKLSSGKLIVNAKALPTEGQPVDFSGAVGNFDFTIAMEHNQVPAGKPTNVSVKVKGIGNFKLFDLPKLKVPQGLELYDPKHSENVRATAQGNTGSVSDEYIVIPNSGGKFIIPAIRFVYFDPKTKTYISKTSKDLVLFATGQVSQNSQTTPTQNTGTNYQNSDFRFIKENSHFFTPKTNTFINSKLFHILLIIPFILAFLGFGFYKYQSTRVYDETREKQKKSKSLAAKYLNEAKKNTGNKDSFYTHLEKAIHNFIKAKLNIDTAEISKDNIKKHLLDKGISEEKINELLGVLQQCETARYAPDSTSKIEEDYKRAENIMNQL